MEKTEVQNTEKRRRYGQNTEKICLNNEKHTRIHQEKFLAFLQRNLDFLHKWKLDFLYNTVEKAKLDSEL